MVGRADIIRFLGAKGVPPQCPSCGKNDWTVTDGTVTSPHALVMVLQQNGFSIPPPGYPAAVLICNNCGFLRQHSLGMIEAWLGKKEEKAEAPSGQAETPEVGDG